MIVDVFHHRRRDQTRWIQNRCKSLIFSIVPESHLSSDIAEQMRVVRNQSQAPNSVAWLRLNITQFRQRFIEPFFKRSVTRFCPVANIAIEKLGGECSAPTECDGFFAIIGRGEIRRCTPLIILRIAAEPKKRPA